MMKAKTLKTVSRRLRAVGPYLLVELLLPGGTLIAFLLWLSQHNWAQAPNLAPLAATVVTQAR